MDAAAVGVSSGHEQVVHHDDPQSGLRAIVAIADTTLGPALGGTRFFPYPDESAALVDVLSLSTAMTYKNAVAGLDHGGGKAVIIGDPSIDKTEALLLAYGRLIESIGGRYVTASDVGTYVSDMDVVARTTKYVTGRSLDQGGCGDSAELTAVGVFRGMRAAAMHRWGFLSLIGRRVGVIGVGKVGRRLAHLLFDDDAIVVVTDVSRSATAAIMADIPNASVLPDAAAVFETEFDIVAPCALGNAITREVAERIQTEIVCGAANNQLASAAAGAVLGQREILYAPDYVVNAGGVIAVGAEWQGRVQETGYRDAQARRRALQIYDTTLRVLRTAQAEGMRPEQAADQIAERRIAAAKAT